jgi:hypothetical protein
MMIRATAGPLTRPLVRLSAAQVDALKSQLAAGMLSISGCDSALEVGDLHRLAPSSSTARIF